MGVVVFMECHSVDSITLRNVQKHFLHTSEIRLNGFFFSLGRILDVLMQKYVTKVQWKHLCFIIYATQDVTCMVT